MKLMKYRITCETEGVTKEWFLPFGAPSPTACPDDTNHQVDLSSVVVTQAGDPVPLYTNTGEQLVAPTFEYDRDYPATWVGKTYTVQPGVLNIFELEITREIFLRGGSVQLLTPPASVKAHKDDYIEFSVVDKNDVLGMFSLLGLTVGVDILELGKFVRTKKVVGHCPEPLVFMAKGASQVFPGLFFYTHYRSFGTEAHDIEVVYNFHEGPAV